jgi:AraC-like DNA-binding protein
MKQAAIKVWRLPEFAHLEMRRGLAVAAPYPKHFHEEYQLCLVEAGGGELLYNGQAHPTPARSLFILAPGETHANRTAHAQGCTFRTLYLAPDWVRHTLAEMTEQQQALPCFPQPLIFERLALAQFRRLHLSLEQTTTQLERETRLLEFLLLLATRYAAEQPVWCAPGIEKPVAQRLRDFIADCYAEKIALAELACLAQLSPFHVNRVFCAEYGLPPHAFQTQVRIAHAKRLLHAGLPIAEVAAQTGFADQSHLTRHFKRLVMLPPGQYQRDSKNVQDAAELAA